MTRHKRSVGGDDGNFEKALKALGSPKRTGDQPPPVSHAERLTDKGYEPGVKPREDKSPSAD